jgi:hypothetical protein
MLRFINADSKKKKKNCKLVAMAEDDEMIQLPSEHITN